MVNLLQASLVSSPLLILAATMSLGILAGHHGTPQPELVFPVTLILSVGFGLFAASLTIKKQTNKNKWLAREKHLALAWVFLLAALFCAGFALSLTSSRTHEANRISRMMEDGTISSGDPVEVTGVIQGEPEPAPQSFYLTIRAEVATLRGVDHEATGTLLMLARIPNQQVAHQYQLLALHHGARVRVMTTVAREDDYRNPGVMLFTEYLEREGYDATGIIKSPLLVERLDDEKVFLPLAWIYSWRARLQREFSKIFSAETAGVVDAALLGNPYNISAGAAERFRSGGTFHILVISGLQIAFVAGLGLPLARRITHRKLLQFLLAVTFLWAYPIAVGAQPSVARAALMFTLAAFAPLVARRSNSLNTVSGAALLLLIWNPSTLFDPSFQLTFLSELAIICLAVPLLRNMQRVGSWQPTTATPYPPDCRPWFRKLSETLFWSQRDWQAEIAASNISYRLYKAPLAAKLERWRIQPLLRFAMAAIVISASVQIVLLPVLILYFHRLSIASLGLHIFVCFLIVVLGLAALAAVLVAQVSVTLASPFVFVAEKINWLMIHLVDPFTRLGLASFRLPHYHGAAGAIYILYFLFVIGLVMVIPRWDPLRQNGRAARRNLFSRPIAVFSVLVALTLTIVIVHPLSAAAPDGIVHIAFFDVG